MLMIWLYPLVIAPLFNKYVPVKDEALRDRILAMAEKAGLRAEGIFEVDAGKRSRHSNAYFTGLGRSKRIVLFDTLSPPTATMRSWPCSPTKSATGSFATS